jgi:hypothetical protein
MSVQRAIQPDAIARDVGDAGPQNPLLRPPAFGDNAAMETEPPTADPPKRKRRWFQFSLRTLMIFTMVVAAACGWVGWQAKIVRDRKSELNRTVNMRLVGIDSDDQAKAIPWVRRLFGDVSVNSISMPPETTIDELDRLRALFPESKVTSDNRLDSPERQQAQVRVSPD